MHATLSIRIVTGDIPADSGASRLRILLKGYSALDIRVTTENSDCGAKRLALSALVKLDVIVT